jgi:lipoyl(octanoyl) transferase
MPDICLVHRLGLVPYQEAWDLQGGLAQEISEGKQPPTLLLLQHPHIFTFGRRGNPANLLWDHDEQVRRQVQVLWVDRGGDVTYHGPGQLVGYPLIPLATPVSIPSNVPKSEDLSAYGRLPQADYVGYLRRLEQVLIHALAVFGISGKQIEGKTGVWVDLPGPQPADKLEKIAAIGVKVDVHGITRHGFALNVNPDMSYWDGIIGCGLKDDQPASLADFMQPAPMMSKVEQAVIEAFKEVFHLRMVESQLGKIGARKLGLNSV